MFTPPSNTLALSALLDDPLAASSVLPVPLAPPPLLEAPLSSLAASLPPLPLEPEPGCPAPPPLRLSIGGALALDDPQAPMATAKQMNVSLLDFISCSQPGI